MEYDIITAKTEDEYKTEKENWAKKTATATTEHDRETKTKDLSLIHI